MASHAEYILTLSCPDTHGIVAAVTGFLAAKQGFIMESTQFGDPSTQQFFMRVHFHAQHAQAVLANAFADEVAKRFAMRWQLHDAKAKTRTLILVSKQLHCLNDLMHRTRTGRLNIEIPAVISNHEEARSMVEWHGIPFYHFPMDGGKEAQEASIREVLQRERIGLTVLARYMQILSPAFSSELRGAAINIHHSFLPSFKGAKPYHQAYERGVKLIGATAHYVTDALDEGPIIEQEVVRVDHAQSPEDLAEIGHDTEALVLARAVKYATEHRVLLNGNKTVVFR
jgi:formyltetrahydrofolate deformylase